MYTQDEDPRDPGGTGQLEAGHRGLLVIVIIVTIASVVVVVVLMIVVIVILVVIIVVIAGLGLHGRPDLSGP